MRRLAANLAWSALVVPLVLALDRPAMSRDLVYVPLGSANQILVVDADQDLVIDSIQDTKAVHGLAATPDGSLLIAGSFEEREPSVEAVAKPSAMSEQEHAEHHVRPPEGPVGALEAVSSVTVVRTSDATVVRQIDVPGAVHHVAVSPDGRLAAVTHPGQNGISVIDMRSLQLIKTLPTGALPNYAVFDPDGSKLYVSNAGDGTVSAIDTNQWVVSWDAVVGASPEHIVLSGDGAVLYVNNVEDGTVSVLDVKTATVTKKIPIGHTVHGIDLSDDGGTLFVAALGDDKLVAVDLVTGAIRSARLSPAPYHLAVIRRTGKLYVSSAEAPNIWVVNQGSLAVEAKITIGGKGHQMVQAPKRLPN